MSFSRPAPITSAPRFTPGCRPIRAAAAAVVDRLERRSMLSTNVLQYHGGAASDGVDSTEASASTIP